MEDKDIIRIWKKESDKSKNEKPITMETIENLVKLRSGKAAKKIRWDLYFSLVIYIAGIINYFKGGYKLWQLLYPIGLVVLVFSVPLLVDYQNGVYRINHPFEFIAIMVVMLTFMYLPAFYTRSVYLQDLENCLKNLDEQEYTTIDKTLKRHRIFILFFVVGLVLLVLGSLVAWYYFAGK